jgi:hypothetical protein
MIFAHVFVIAALLTALLLGVPSSLPPSIEAAVAQSSDPGSGGVCIDPDGNPTTNPRYCKPASGDP